MTDPEHEFILDEGEAAILTARKHWFLFLTELLPYAIIAVVPLALPNILHFSPTLAPFDTLFAYGTPLGRAALGVWLLITWTAAWGVFTKYFLNAWILTSKRIVNIKQRRFFSRQVSSLLLTRVQDVTTEVTGVIPSLLGIGDIKVQTASEEVEFVMHSIPHPETVRELILKYVPEEDPRNASV